jgi:hypothetical protein
VPKPRGVKRTRDELEGELAEQLQLLTHACRAYDEGLEAIGKHIALSIRVLVHHRGQSNSLLHQLGLRSMPFFDSAGPLNPRNLLTQHNLVALRVTTEGGRYVPTLDDKIPSARWVPFPQWWNDPVLKDRVRSTFSRGDLILHVSDTDGGAHVDPELDARYMALSRANSLAWEFRAGDIVKALDGRPELACIRQIAHELLSTIHRSVPKFREDAQPVVPTTR